MTAGEMIHLAMAALSFLVVLGGLAKIFMKMNTDQKVYQEKMNGLEERMVSEINRIENNGLKHLKELHTTCIETRIKNEITLQGKLEDLTKTVVRLETVLGK